MKARNPRFTTRAGRSSELSAGPGFEGQHTGQDLEQRRLAGPVVPHQGDLLPPADQQVQALVDRIRSVALGQPGELHDVGAGTAGLGKSEADPFFLTLHLDPIYLVQQLQPTLGLARRGGVARHPRALREARGVRRPYLATRRGPPARCSPGDVSLIP